METTGLLDPFPLWALGAGCRGHGKDRSPITGLFVASLNDVIDLHATRVMAESCADLRKTMK